MRIVVRAAWGQVGEAVKRPLTLHSVRGTLTLVLGGRRATIV